MIHLIQFLKYLNQQGFSYAELTETFTVYFPEQGHSMDDILEYFEVSIDEKQAEYIEKALPNVESAIAVLKIA